MATARDLFERHHLAVFRFFRRTVPDLAEAEDLTQEVFLRVHRGLGGFRPEGKDVAWLFRIARNLSLNRKRDRSRAPDVGPLDLAVVPTPAPLRTDRLDLERALAALPHSEREAFLLREIGGLGYAEIAEAVGATPDAARNRIHRARLALREALGPASGRER